MSKELSTAEKAEALRLAANTLDYVWKVTLEEETTETDALGLSQEFAWFGDGYQAAIDELRQAAGMLDEYAAGNIREVNGL